jgi:hypothetical protein
VRSPTRRGCVVVERHVGGSASRSELITPGRLQPGTFGACRQPVAVRVEHTGPADDGMRDALPGEPAAADHVVRDRRRRPSPARRRSRAVALVARATIVAGQIGRGDADPGAPMSTPTT